ncbi:PREDICTED: uncharacterized protein LOC109238785 [Nicotiana attenuata]|uniref:uncharacterized protein LOC109238785 n=1 Tax=Nicotiana attenuata TaxID=49451 RepID=UPI00090586CE|nr:PREDICTED: uncharacterized protein LOC109238785 [Nicotiana attenuata]
MSHRPSINKAYSMIISEESKREISHSSQVSEINEGVTLFSNKGTCSGAPIQLNAKGNLGQNHNFLGNEVTSWFSSKGNAGAGYGHSGGSTPNFVGTSLMQQASKNFQAGIPQFTREQYSQILQLPGKQPVCSGSAMAAGSGASSHMANDSSWLVNVKTVGDKGEKVHLPTDSVAHISHIGYAYILKDLIVSNVMHITDFKYNLLSVSKLTKEMRWFVMFFPNFFIFQELISGQVRGIGREKDVLYVFNSTSKKSVALQDQSPIAEILNIPRPILTVNIIKVHNKVVNVALWHTMLGHAPLDTLKKLNDFHDFQAAACSSKDKFTIYDGKRYFLTLVDDYSRYTWLFLLPTKAEVIVALRSFFTMIKNVYLAPVNFFRSDNGCEFFNSHVTELLQSLGIIHQSSCIYTPQQNGVAKRRHKYILEMVRALRFQASVPLRFWGECINTAVYIINRLPSTVLHKRSPFEIKFGHSPSLHHMRVFGCLGYVTTVRRPDKFASRTYPAVFLGYSAIHKGYRMFRLHTKEFHISGDVVFKEDVFPFQHMSSKNSTLFPILDFTTISSTVPADASWTPPAQSIPLSSPVSSNSDVPSIHLSPVSGLPDHVTVNDAPAPIRAIYVEPSDDNRKSIRVSRPPIWMKDYIVHRKGSAHYCYPISDSVNYANVSPSLGAGLAAYSAIVEP